MQGLRSLHGCSVDLGDNVSISLVRQNVSSRPSPAGRLRINFDITFPGLQCSEANLDAMDVAGEQQNGIVHDMLKMR